MKILTNSECFLVEIPSLLVLALNEHAVSLVHESCSERVAGQSGDSLVSRPDPRQKGGSGSLYSGTPLLWDLVKCPA